MDRIIDYEKSRIDTLNYSFDQLVGNLKEKEKLESYELVNTIKLLREINRNIVELEDSINKLIMDEEDENDVKFYNDFMSTFGPSIVLFSVKWHAENKKLKIE